METPSTSAVSEFLLYKLKLAQQQVKAHTRVVDGEEVQVGSYSRDAGAGGVTAAPAELSDEDRQAELRAKQAAEIEMWKAWKNSGMPSSGLGPLLRTFAPMLKSKMAPYLGRLRLVPDAAIKSEFQIQFVSALRSYDPEKGSLGTHVYRSLDKAKRFIAEKQNIGRIPENRIYKIRQYQVADDDLREKLGREPTDAELADELGWSPSEAGRMRSELRSDLTSQGFAEDPYALIPSKSEEVLRLFKYELEGDERAVYEHLTGYGREHLTSTGDISEKLGIPDYVVSRIKNKIKDKISKYL